MGLFARQVSKILGLIAAAGGPDSLPVRAAKPHEASGVSLSSCAFGTPIDELSGPPRSMRLYARQVSKILGLIAAASVSHALLWGSDPDLTRQIPWATGKQLSQTLAQPLDVFWPNNPLREALTGLSRAQRVAILLDRRVDPGQKLSLNVQNVPLQTVLQMVADRCGLGVSRLGAVVYLGPPSAAQRLRPIAAALEKAVRQLPAASQRKFFQSKPWAWEDLSTPRDLLEQLGQQNGIQIAGLERVPHDLWAAADLPPLSLVERLTLIAAQFDLTCKLAAGGARLDLVPVPESLLALPADRPPIPAEPASTKRAEPATSVERIRIQRLSVRAEPLGPVLRQLAQRLGLELKLDEPAIQQAGISLDQRVSVLVENASVDELLHQLLKSTGLSFRRHQNVVEILPAN